MVYLFLADGFEEIEALTPVDMLRRAGIEIFTVSINATPTVTGAHGIKVVADTTADRLTDDAADAVILPGGLPGADNLRMNKTVQRHIDLAVNDGKLVCAICAAPRILGEKGLLKGKNAVCYPGFEGELEGAMVLEGETVVRDGNVITAKGMGVAFEFGLELVRCLCDDETAEKIKASVFG